LRAQAGAKIAAARSGANRPRVETMDRSGTHLTALLGTTLLICACAKDPAAAADAPVSGRDVPAALAPLHVPAAAVVADVVDPVAPPVPMLDDAATPPGDAGPPADAAAPARPPLPRGERTQFVLLSIDTTPGWRRTGGCTGFCNLFQALNRGRDPALPPNSFTVFISTGGMQFDPDRRRVTDAERPYLGVAPRLAPVYQYADGVEHILIKVRNIRELDELGVELGSHSVRHAHGGGWSEEAWRFELADHQRILDLVGLPRPSGFRAPFLDWSPGLYPALEAMGMVYDTSQVGGRAWPVRAPGSRIWIFGVPSVSIPGHPNALFYDFNLEERLRQAAVGKGIAGEANLRRWIDDAFYAVANGEFQRRYAGNRAPFLVSGHGTFLEPILRLMKRICPLPGVRCATFREAAAYLDAHPELEGVDGE
jgi:hypothetical protein